MLESISNGVTFAWDQFSSLVANANVVLLVSIPLGFAIASRSVGLFKHVASLGGRGRR